MGKSPFAAGRYLSRYAARFASDDVSPVAWSSAEMSEGTLSARISTRVPVSAASTSQVIVMVPAYARVIRHEVNDLHNPDILNDLDEACFDNVRVISGLACPSYCVRIGKDQPVEATRPGIEPFEAAAHPARRQPDT